MSSGYSLKCPWCDHSVNRGYCTFCPYKDPRLNRSPGGYRPSSSSNSGFNPQYPRQNITSLSASTTGTVPTVGNYQQPNREPEKRFTESQEYKPYRKWRIEDYNYKSKDFDPYEIQAINARATMNGNEYAKCKFSICKELHKKELIDQHYQDAHYCDEPKCDEIFQLERYKKEHGNKHYRF